MYQGLLDIPISDSESCDECGGPLVRQQTTGDVSCSQCGLQPTYREPEYVPPLPVREIGSFHNAPLSRRISLMRVPGSNRRYYFGKKHYARHHDYIERVGSLCRLKAQTVDIATQLLYRMEQQGSWSLACRSLFGLVAVILATRIKGEAVLLSELKAAWIDIGAPDRFIRDERKSGSQDGTPSSKKRKGDAILRTMLQIKKRLRLKIRTFARPRDFVNRVLDHIEREREMDRMVIGTLRTEANRLLNSLSAELCGRNPICAAAAAIWITGDLEGLKIPEEAFAQFVDSQTIRSIHRRVLEALHSRSTSLNDLLLSPRSE